VNYYNEHDPKAAQWLRALIDANLIPAGDVDTRSITKLNQVPSTGSAYDQEAHDMSDKAPKPFQATCSSWNFSIVRFSRIQVCAQHQELESLRKTHKILVLPDYIAESGSNWSRVVVYLYSAAYTQILFLGFSNATHEPFLPPWRGGTHWSRSIFGFDRAEWGILSRNFYRCAHSLGLVYLPTSKTPHISESKNCRPSAEINEAFHTVYKVLCLTCFEYDRTSFIVK